MIFGTFLLFFGGVKFKTFLFIIAGVLTFLLIVTTLMTIFNVPIGRSVLALFYSIGIIGALIFKYIKDLWD